MNNTGFQIGSRVGKHSSEVFNSLNSFFDKVFVITLKRSKDRQEHFEKNLAGLQYDIHWGFDGEETSLEELIDKGLYNQHLAKHLKVLYDSPAKDVLLNSIACTISHTALYKKILDSGFERVLVLEDDIMLEKHVIPDNLTGSFEELPKHWDLFYLGHLNNNISRTLSTKIRMKFLYPILLKLGYKRYDPEIAKRRYPREFSANIERSGAHYGTHAYGISSSGASKLLRYQKPVSREIDIALSDLCMHGFIDAYSLKKRLFAQNRKELPSTIESGKFKTYPG